MFSQEATEESHKDLISNCQMQISQNAMSINGKASSLSLVPLAQKRVVNQQKRIVDVRVCMSFSVGVCVCVCFGSWVIMYLYLIAAIGQGHGSNSEAHHRQ